MNKAIKLAIEKGGYIPLITNISNHDREFYSNAEQDSVMLDAKFWQALGKALGKDPQKGDWWYSTAMDYFHEILTGGDTEKFLEDLLGT